jgi:adenine-specific DNA methylase
MGYGSVTATAAQGVLFEASLRPSSTRPGGIEGAFSVPFVAELALKEKQIQQNVRPVIAVHKWFARRPGTLFRALLLAEFGEPPLEKAYFQPHRLDGLRVADPFMGGGTPLFEANRLGCDVFGWDVNPMAYWIVRQEIEHLDLFGYEEAALRIAAALEADVGGLYRTTCKRCRREDAHVKYFIWVKTVECEACAAEVTLFPGLVLAHAGRHPRHVLVCRPCGGLSEVDDLGEPGRCGDCGEPLALEGNAGRGRCECPACGHAQTYSRAAEGPPRHRMVAIEYHCTHCRAGHRGRFFKSPDEADLERYASAERSLARIRPKVIPADRIPAGDETARLHRWGYGCYREMFNARQLLGLEKLGRLILNVSELQTRNALATNFSDLLRYQNMVCRYDSRALKSLDIFSVHGFPVGLIQCESNLLGIQREGTRANIGSGGWSNIFEKYLKAKRFCQTPFEIRYKGRRKSVVPMRGEWIGDRRNGVGRGRRIVALHAGSAEEASLSEASLDAVLTDPPYFANVQYAELMDFCYVWLRKLLSGEEAFKPATTRNAAELTGNVTLNRDLDHFTAGLAVVFGRMARALKPGRPFVFTYHHNALEAYYPIAVALLDANLGCTASLPCPAEMGGSIHIHGTESSIVDTVFVCRSTGRVRRSQLAGSGRDLAELVWRDIELLRQGGVRVTRGDARCVAFGHLIRIVVWELRHDWDRDGTTSEKLARVGRAAKILGGWAEIEKWLDDDVLRESRRGRSVHEPGSAYDGVIDDEVSF